VNHDLAAKDSREDKHPPRTCKDHVVEGAEFTLVLGELTRGRMANSAFSAIWSLHSFVAYSLFQLPRFFLPTVLPAWTISWMMSVPFAPFSTRRMRWPSKATATLIAARSRCSERDFDWRTLDAQRPAKRLIRSRRMSGRRAHLFEAGWHSRRRPVDPHKVAREPCAGRQTVKSLRARSLRRALAPHDDCAG
jgi:hypothetical protein